ALGDDDERPLGFAKNDLKVFLLHAHNRAGGLNGIGDCRCCCCSCRHKVIPPCRYYDSLKKAPSERTGTQRLAFSSAASLTSLSSLRAIFSLPELQLLKCS